MQKNKPPKIFRDENGEECRLATRGECLLISLVCWTGFIALIGLCILSRMIYARMCAGLWGN